MPPELLSFQWLSGNGGSCADAQHIVGELMKGFYLKRLLSGTERAALADALGEGGADLAGMLQGSLPAIALSEHSALTGGTGGMLAKAADAAIVVPASVTADAQELHLPVYHTLCAMLEERFFGSSE
jgi:D-sedoheptulose 7-phosphate isomerase